MVASDGDKTSHLTMQIGDKTLGGEMSYDNVKGEYYYTCPWDSAPLSSITCFLEYGETQIELVATSVVTPSTIPPRDALKRVQTENEELFSSMTDKYGFAGEIYIRLLYEDAPYYYVGVIRRDGGCNAFLMNAETGKILAKRES